MVAVVGFRSALRLKSSSRVHRAACRELGYNIVEQENPIAELSLRENMSVLPSILRTVVKAMRGVQVQSTEPSYSVLSARVWEVEPEAHPGPSEWIELAV